MKMNLQQQRKINNRSRQSTHYDEVKESETERGKSFLNEIEND